MKKQMIMATTGLALGGLAHTDTLIGEHDMEPTTETPTAKTVKNNTTGKERAVMRLAAKRQANSEIPSAEYPNTRQVRRADERGDVKTARRHLNESIKGKNRKRRSG